MADKGYEYHITHTNGTTAQETVYGETREEAEKTGIEPRGDVDSYAYLGEKK